MSTILQLVSWEMQAFLLALFAMIALRLLNGRINTAGLLEGKHGNLSPERVQLLLATLASSYEYLTLVLKDPTHFPEVSPQWVALFGGSHVLYLGSKYFANRPRSSSRS